MHIDFTKAFIDGRKITTEYGEATYRCHTLGDLVVTSGRIIACDPFVYPDREAFTITLPPGNHPVVVSVAEFDEDQRVAYAKLAISNNTPIRWEMALLPNQDVNILQKGEIFGYPVDSGTGCFMDAESALLFLQKNEDENFGEFLIEEMEKNYVHTWDWLNFCLDETTKANVITFKSGLGDGYYASYFGYDEDNKVASLVTDFAVIDDEEVFRK